MDSAGGSCEELTVSIFCQKRGEAKKWRKKIFKRTQRNAELVDCGIRERGGPKHEWMVAAITESDPGV